MLHIFVSLIADGTGGGQIELPNDYGIKNVQYPPSGDTTDTHRGNSEGGGIPPFFLWIVIGCVSGVTVIAVIIVTVIVCRRRMAENERKRRK